MNVKIVRIMARFGTPSPVIGIVMIGLSILLTPEWSITQPLSDLGTEGFGSMLFNSGLLMTGALAMLLAAGLFEFSKGDLVGQIGSAAFLGYSIATCAIGIVIIDIGALHEQFVTVLFILIPISAALLSYSVYMKGLKKHALLGLVAIVFGLATWVLGGPVDAVKQLMAIIPFGLWQIAIGLHMYGLKEPNEWN